MIPKPPCAKCGKVKKGVTHRLTIELDLDLQPGAKPRTLLADLCDGCTKKLVRWIRGEGR